MDHDTRHGDDRTGLISLLIVLSLPGLAILAIVFGDPGVSLSLLRALIVTFAIGAAITGAIFAFFILRGDRWQGSDRP